jgi:hypothetical protein
MTTTTGDRLLSDYIARLDTAALRLPPDRRAELMEGIAEHIAAARASGELRDEAAVRTLLDRLGEPEEIVAAAAEEVAGGGGTPPPWASSGPQLVPTRPGTGLEVAAVVMLTAGSLLPVLGWLVGVALLWSSKRWRTSEKLLGTLVVPGGPGIVLPLSLLRLGPTCTTSFGGTVGGGTGGVLVGPQQPPAPGAPPELGPPDVGFAPPPQEAATTVCEGGLPLPGWLLIAFGAFALIGPFVLAVVLLRRARARAAAEPPVLRPVGGSPWSGLEIGAVVLLGAGSFVLPVRRGRRASGRRRRRASRPRSWRPPPCWRSSRGGSPCSASPSGSRRSGQGCWSWACSSASARCWPLGTSPSR